MPVAVEVVMLSVRARVILSRRGLPGALEAFDLGPAERQAPPPDDGTWSGPAHHLARVAGVLLDTPPVKSTCLPTAFTLCEVLHRHGVASDVVIGVSADRGFSAHAWVELFEGRIDLARHPLSAHTEISRFRHRQPVGSA